VCNKSGIGGSGEYYGDNDAHFGRIDVCYRKALGSKYVFCAVLFELEPGVIDAATLCRRSTNSSARATS
jgi:hypothetical protein